MLFDTGLIAAAVRSASAISVSVPSIKIMSKLQQISHYVAWEHPYPVKNRIGRYPGKEGVNLPNSLTEDIRGVSLCPAYSHGQLRRISRLRIRKIGYGHGGGNLKELRHDSGQMPPNNFKASLGEILTW